jgi:hypothetical protein
MFKITKDGTPILAQQSQAVQDAAVKAQSEYTNQKSVAMRRSWGSLLEPIKNGNLKLVDAGGNPTDHKKTWSAICRELGIPRSSADRYIDEFVASKTYPKAVQELAATEGLNLALQHVMDKWTELTGPGGDLEGKDVSKLSPLEVKGVVSQLEEAKAPKEAKKAKGTTAQQFTDLLKEAFEFAKEGGLKSEEVIKCLNGLSAIYGAILPQLTEVAPGMFSVAGPKQ